MVLHGPWLGVNERFCSLIYPNRMELHGIGMGVDNSY